MKPAFVLSAQGQVLILLVFRARPLLTKLMFTDNDELDSMTAAMIDADTLILLTNVDGIFKSYPDDPAYKLIERVSRRTSGVSR